MIKRALSYLIFGGGSGIIAILSTKYSFDNNNSQLLIEKERIIKNPIKTISSYGDIDVYGLQNGCIFRIVDENSDNPKDYSLVDFWVNKKDKVANLEADVVKVANEGKLFCGKHSSIVTIFHTKIKDPKKFPPLHKPEEIEVFKLKRSAIATE